MNRQWKKFKNWSRKQARRMRLWVLGILIAIGVVVIPPALGGEKDFSWTNPTQNTDGSSFDAATELREVRIYCTREGVGIPVIVSLGDATQLTATLSSGDYECYATATSNEGAESFPSGSVTFTVDPLIPNPPVLQP